MDVKTARRQNLNMLIDQHGGEVETFADQYDLSANYLSQLRNSRGMGDKFARKVERRVDLPEGWMDQPHTNLWENEALPADTRKSLVFNPRTRAFLKRLSRLSPLDQVYIIGRADEIMAKLTPNQSQKTTVA